MRKKKTSASSTCCGYSCVFVFIFHFKLFNINIYPFIYLYPPLHSSPKNPINMNMPQGLSISSATWQSHTKFDTNTIKKCAHMEVWYISCRSIQPYVINYLKCPILLWNVSFPESSTTAFSPVTLPEFDFFDRVWMTTSVGQFCHQYIDQYSHHLSFP